MEAGDVDSGMDLRVRFSVDDAALTVLHNRAFGSSLTTVHPWSRQLDRYSLTWVGAFAGDVLIGFVQLAWDGGVHAFLLDTAVDPDHQRRGVGRALVAAAAAEATHAGCEWVHVDFEPHLASFYRDACGFTSTDAGLRRLPTAPTPG